jgi:hypothetical protein
MSWVSHRCSHLFSSSSNIASIRHLKSVGGYYRHLALYCLLYIWRCGRFSKGRTMHSCFCTQERWTNLVCNNAIWLRQATISSLLVRSSFQSRLCAIIACVRLFKRSCSVNLTVWRDYCLESFTCRLKHLYITTTRHIYSKFLSAFITESNFFTRPALLHSCYVTFLSILIRFSVN